MGDMNELANAIASLKRAILDKQREIDMLTKTCEQLEATAKLINPHAVPASTEYSGKTISEAAHQFLRDSGRAASTREIAEGILAKGMRTTSKNFPMTVYTILREDKGIKRTGAGLWELKEK